MSSITMLIQKSTILVSVVDNEEDCTCVWGGHKWEISVPFSQFCCKLKTPIKINLLSTLPILEQLHLI